MATGSLYGSVSESTGLYGIGAASGGTYFEWFIFYDSATAPATPTGGSWSFTTNTGTAPSGWLNAPPASPTNLVWVSIAVVDSRSTSTLTWSAPGLMTGSGLPILTGSGVPSSGTGLNGQLYVNTATTPQSMYLKEAGSWVQITGSNLVDLVNNQTIGGVKTFSSTIVGNISGTAGNVSGTVAIANGGTGGTTASGARTNLGLGTIATQASSSVSITGGSITGITDLAIADGGTGASTAANARTNLGAVGLTDVQTLTNKTISGASNTLTNIGNSSLSNSTVTVNGSSIALGSSATVTASTPNNLVFGSQLSANASFNGSQQVNVNLLSVSTPGTYGTSNVVPVFTLNSYGQITSVSPQTITIDTTDISGTIGIAQGGTGANTVTAARVNLLPSYTGNGGKLLALNAGATDLEWKAVSGIGTVTSVDVSGGTTGLTTYGGPITAAGTVTLAGTLNVANGGTGVTTSTGSGSTVLSTSPSLTTPTQVSYEAWTGITAPTFTEGRMWYDSTAHSLSYYNDVSSAIVHVGQDLIVKVINNTGSTIANGSPVYITGTSSGQTYPNIALAKADAAATSAVIGLTNGAIANGAVGYVTAQGGIDGVNTSSFTVGQVLYLSPYSAGQLQNTIPPTGITVQVGVVSYVNASGKIYVKQTTPLAVPASIITGTLGITNGGTGQTTANAALNALLPSQTSNANKYLQTDGTNTSWDAISLSTSDITGTLGTANGGTGLTSFTSGGVVYASSTSALATGSALTFNGTTLTLGGNGSFESAFSGNGLVVSKTNVGPVNAIRSIANTSDVLLINDSASGFANTAFYASGSEQMRLTSTGLEVKQSQLIGYSSYAGIGTNGLAVAGNVGIGTSSPAYKLDVSGTAASQLRLQNSDATSYASMLFSGTGRTYSIGVGNASETGIQVANQFYIYDSTAGAVRVRLDSAGNLGLGVTPSANTIAKAFELQNGFNLFSAFNIGYINANAYFDGNWKYKNTAASGRYEVADSHKWYNAPSGTAGNAITFTQAMTLDASGRLGIGNTSPDTTLAIGSSAGSGSNGLGIYLARGATTNFLEAYDGTKTFIGGTDSTNGYVKVGSLSNHPVAIVQANGSAIYIDTSKNVGIGTTSPAAKLEIGGTNPTINIGATNSASGAALSYNTSGNYFSINAVTQGVGYRDIVIANDGGSLLVGTASSDSGVKLKVVGGIIKCLDVYNNTTASAANVQIDSNGNFARSTSSLKYKTDVQNTTHGLSQVISLRPVTYKGKHDGDTVFGGLIAEEVHAVGLTEFVQYAPDGTPDALAYGNMVSLAFKAIQEQQAIIESIKARLDAANL